MTLADVRAKRMKASLLHLLGPEEPVEAVMAASTFHPVFRAVFLFAFLLGGRYRIIAATERRLIIVSTKSFSSDKFVALAVVEELPRETPVGPVVGTPPRVTLGGKRYFLLGGTKKFAALIDRPSS
jgi:hypothetical protein